MLSDSAEYLSEDLVVFGRCSEFDAKDLLFRFPLATHRGLSIGSELEAYVLKYGCAERYQVLLVSGKEGLFDYGKTENPIHFLKVGLGHFVATSRTVFHVAA